MGHDNNGLLIFAERWNIHEALSSKTTELITVKEGLKRAINSRLSKLIIETDSIQVVQDIIWKSMFLPDEPIAEKIRNPCSRIQELGIQHCRRNANHVADVLAQLSLHNGRHFVF